MSEKDWNGLGRAGVGGGRGGLVLESRGEGGLGGERVRVSLGKQIGKRVGVRGKSRAEGVQGGGGQRCF